MESEIIIIGFRDYTRRIRSLFEMKKILIPVSTPNHWSFAGIDMERKEITYFDSKGWRNPQCMSLLLDYLKNEHWNKTKIVLDTSEWTARHASDIPKQNNDDDCGVFTIKYSEYFARGEKCTFKVEDMPYYRQCLIYGIATGTLM